MEFNIGRNVAVGNGKLVVMAGPCMAESLDICMETARFLKKLCADIGAGYVFKASYDKANRSSDGAARGPGRMAGLAMLQDVKNELGVPILTDVHEVADVDAAAQVADVLQIPAFLCRQTDLLHAAGKSKRVVNIKKGQFMAPEDMAGAVEKVRSVGGERVMLTERGSCFGYHNLVNDMRGLVVMRELGVPVVFDATHSVQLPCAGGNCSGGRREFVAPLARAATAVGIDALFIEVHPDPDHALSDGPNSLNFEQAGQVIREVARLYEFVRAL
ncbi:MAG: 3-deoxy-8-phosphooctulonate synthase [Victivallaceae bacterium]|nr:3-deoxy-8-phosphooctulonate synthase [Victivallaceae bacterium]